MQLLPAAKTQVNFETTAKVILKAIQNCNFNRHWPSLGGFLFEKLTWDSY